MARCEQCGKELKGYNALSIPFLCTACRQARELERQGDEARKWRREQEWEREREREEREEREREEHEREEHEREEREREREHQEEIHREEIAYDNALPKCKWCGKQYSFAPESNSFFDYCSKRCAVEDLGKDKIEEYSQTGLEIIKEQINDAFEHRDWYKAIVLSEGYSEYFSVEQHIYVANKFVEHRKYFFSEDDLIRISFDKHYQMALDKATESQYFKIIYPFLTKSTHCFLETSWGNMLSIPSEISKHSEAVASFWLPKFVNRYTNIEPEHWDTIKKSLKNLTNMLTNIYSESSSPILNSMIEEELKRQEEERRMREEEKRIQQAKNEIESEIKKLTEEQESIRTESPLGCFYFLLILVCICVVWVLLVAILDNERDGLTLLFPIFLGGGPLLIAFWRQGEKAKKEAQKKIETIEQKIKELKQTENELAINDSEEDIEKDDEEESQKRENRIRLVSTLSLLASSPSRQKSVLKDS